MSSLPSDRYATYDVVPADFDLLGASTDQLDRYGIPQRPDPKKEPELFDFWRRLVAPPFKAEPPTFQTYEGMKKGGMRTFSMTVPEQAHGGVNHVSSLNWSGAVVSTPHPKRIVLVVGGWRVPSVRQPSTPALGTHSAVARSLTWVGIDGLNGRLPKASLPQIGTGQWVDSPNYFAWWDWWRSGVKGDVIEFIANFDVAPGDEILAGLAVLISEDILYFIKNQRTGAFRSFLVRRQPLGDIEALGKTAEWIMERPTHPVSLKFHPMPDYDPVDFKYCLALAAEQPLAESQLVTLATNGRILKIREMFADPYRSHSVSRAKRRRDPDGSIGVTCTSHDPA